MRRAEAAGWRVRASAAAALRALDPRERIFHEGRRQVVLGHIGERLEDLEMMPCERGPEHHVRLDRRTARDAARDLRHHHGFVVGEFEARLHPFPHAVNRGAIGTALARAHHLERAGHWPIYWL